MIGFLWRFALVYAVLLLPWPGFRQAYERYFCAFGQMVFAHQPSTRFTEFASSPVLAKTDLDTHITLANREKRNARGAGPARILGLDSRGVGWVPTALMLALILATPVSWSRRGWALLWGVGLIHAYLVVCLAVYIWNNSDAASGLDLVRISPFWKPVADGLQETLITQIGPSFAVPVILWLVVTFRRQDFQSVGAAGAVVLFNHEKRQPLPRLWPAGEKAAGSGILAAKSTKGLGAEREYEGRL